MFEVSKTKDKIAEIKEKIIVALDVETRSEALETIAELGEEVGAFKIGLQLFTALGASFVREAAAMSKVKIFLDLKFHDIPNTTSKAAIEASKLGVWMFNVHASGGSEMMRRTVEDVREFCEKESLEHPKIIAVTILTSSTEETLREAGVEKEMNRQVVSLAQLAANCELDGVVASPLEVELIRENVCKKDFLIVTPGIRSSKFKIQSSMSKIENQFGTNDDQRRVMSASEALRAGANYLVIGRPILRAADKISAVREIVKEIENR